MPSDLPLWLTLSGSNYPCLEQIFIVPKMFELLGFDCTCNKNKTQSRHLHRPGRKPRLFRKSRLCREPRLCRRARLCRKPRLCRKARLCRKPRLSRKPRLCRKPRQCRKSRLGRVSSLGRDYPFNKHYIGTLTRENVPSDMCAQHWLKSTVYSRSLIKVFFVSMKKHCILGYPKCAQWRFRSDCAKAQSDLNLRLAHMSEGTFSDVVPHLDGVLFQVFICYT